MNCRVYQWVPNSTLLGYTPTATYSRSTSTITAAAGATTTDVNGSPSITIASQVPFPSQLPSRIVPAQAASPETIPGTSTVSILFTDVLPWVWTIENSAVSGQLIVYTPSAIASALGLSQSSVQTTSLNAYQPLGYNGDTNTILTTWIGTVPTGEVDALQAMLLSPSSRLYQLTGVEGQLMNSVNPSYSLRAFSTSQGTTTLAADNVTQAAEKQKSKTIIVVVVVVCGSAILLLAAFFAFRATKRGSLVLAGGARRQDREIIDPQHRSFQLGGGGRMQLRDEGNYRDSGSSTSSRSTGFSDDSNNGRTTTGGVGGSRSHANSTSVDFGSSSGGGGGTSEGNRSSWWRFSQSSNGGHGGVGEMREHRRINITRGPDGQFDSSMIGQ